MKFYNREAQLSWLGKIADLAQRTAHMVVIAGRRRIGKTELIRSSPPGGVMSSISSFPRRNRRPCWKNSGTSSPNAFR